mmetsp:Transcript_49708/g.58012  ORF Transcript_49708/g.58012 Transcript_49708/m.58012 type:complete len:389 (-) Transcript_49708:512-1678(-)
MSCVLKEDEPLKRIGLIVDSLLKNPNYEPFFESVDWRGLYLFDYPQVITNMIDLGTIKRRLDHGDHYSAVHQVAEDIRLIWKNCMTYNAEGSDFWLLAKLFAKQFEERYRTIQIESDSSSLLMVDEKRKPKPNEAEAFRCSRCGRDNFDSQIELNVHKKTYSGQSTCHSKRCWKCHTCGKSDFRSKSAFVSHATICKDSACTTVASISMQPACLKIQREQLSDFNILITESIELFELAEYGDVRRFAIKHRKRHPQCGDVGIRCAHCAANGVQPPGSVSYPDNLKSLPFNIYNMTKRHLSLSCKHISKHTQIQLTTAKKNTTSQSMQKERIGLPVYLRMIVHAFSLTDKVKNQGIQRIGRLSVSNIEKEVFVSESVPNAPLWKKLRSR